MQPETVRRSGGLPLEEDRLLSEEAEDILEEIATDHRPQLEVEDRGLQRLQDEASRLTQLQQACCSGERKFPPSRVQDRKKLNPQSKSTECAFTAEALHTSETAS